MSSIVAAVLSVVSDITSVSAAISSISPTVLSTTPTTTTRYIPLVTPFKVPSWCSSMPMTFFGDDGGLTSTFWKDSDFPSNDSRQISMRSCYPPHFEYQPDLFATDGYIYSPGVCPSGYYAAKSNGLDGNKKPATSWCCPHGMTFSAFQGCISLTTPTSTATLIAYGETIQMLNPYYVLEPYIPVAWASSDLHLFTPTSAPLAVSQACRAAARSSGAVATRVSAGAPGVAGVPSVPGQSDGLSTGAKAGIGVGAAVAGVGAIVMTVLLLKYRRKAQSSAAELKKRDESETFDEKNGVVIAEAETNSILEADGENSRFEADSISKHAELDSPVIRAEADGSSLRHELDSGWQGFEK